MKKIILGILLCMLSNIGFAGGSAGSYKVVYVRADKSGKGLIKFEQPLGGTPASCASAAHAYHLSFTTLDQGGRSVMSLALAAHAAGRTISATGTGTCLDYSTVESWSFGQVN